MFIECEKLSIEERILLMPSILPLVYIIFEDRKYGYSTGIIMNEILNYQTICKDEFLSLYFTVKKYNHEIARDMLSNFIKNETNRFNQS